jgi:NADH-quinone oxidoreductase subunit F
MGRKLLLEHINVPGINTFAVYREKGGYRSVEKALKTMSPEDVVEEVKKSGLRGRGGAGFPTGMKWSFLAKPEGVPRYLVCNGDESEPGTFKDRYLMTYIPHALIEGMIVSSYALGAHTSYIYIRGEMMPQIRIMEKAIEEAKAADYKRQRRAFRSSRLRLGFGVGWIVGLLLKVQVCTPVCLHV